MFLETREDFIEYSKERKSLSHADFYKRIRKKLNILMDQNYLPEGGKWSFDEENRKKIPKNIQLPTKPGASQSKYLEKIKKIINDNFSSHPGKLSEIWTPLTRRVALRSLDNFMKKKFEKRQYKRI